VVSIQHYNNQNSNTGKRTFDVAYIQIFNLSGSLMDQFDWTEEDIKLDLTAYPKGVYVLSINSIEGVKTEKLIIQ